MTEHTNDQEKEFQPKTTSSTLEWGPWFLWLLAFITAGGLLINKFALDGDDIYGYSPYLASILGAILVGFMPWLASKRKISKFVWWLCTFISTALIIIALTKMDDQPFFKNYSYYFKYRLALNVVLAFPIAYVTRGIGKRKLSSKIRWWDWVFAGILILIIGYIMLWFALLTSIFIPAAPAFDNGTHEHLIRVLA